MAWTVAWTLLALTAACSGPADTEEQPVTDDVTGPQDDTTPDSQAWQEVRFVSDAVHELSVGEGGLSSVAGLQVGVYEATTDRAHIDLDSGDDGYSTRVTRGELLVVGTYQVEIAELHEGSVNFAVREIERPDPPLWIRVPGSRALREIDVQIRSSEDEVTWPVYLRVWDEPGNFSGDAQQDTEVELGIGDTFDFAGYTVTVEERRGRHLLVTVVAPDGTVLPRD